MPKISDQNVVVTGGARGIGRAIAEKFASQGATVCLLDLESQIVRQTAEELTENNPGNVYPLTADVTDFDQLKEKLNSWIDQHGPINTLINNAGITRDGLLLRQKKQDWDMVLDVNLNGAYNCVQAVLKTMMKQRWGRIIMVSSVIGLSGNAGQTNYAASKAALIGLAKSVAQELGSRNITCNAVAPGFIKTEMTDQLPDSQKQQVKNLTPLKRFGLPEEVASAVLFLAGEESGFITGEVLKIDGGMKM